MSYFSSDTITFDAALRDLAGGSDKAREQAAAALADVEAADERERAVAALIDALGDRRSQVRAAAARSLGELGEKAALEPLIATLDDGAAPVRQVAAIALGTLGFGEAFAALAAALVDGPADLRFQAARSMVDVDAERALEPLIAAAAGEADPEVLGQIGLALGEIGEARAASALASRLEELEGEPAFEVAYGLARLGDDRGAEVLAGAVGHRALSWDAIEGLEMIGGEAAARALGQALESRKLAPELKLRAAAAAVAIGPDDIREPARRALLDGLRSWRHHLRALAIAELERVGGPWAVGDLERLASRRRGANLELEIQGALAAIRERS